MQSPDEGVHILRAHLLSKGVLVLKTPPGKLSGGYVDENLLRYQAITSASLAAKPQSKVTQQSVEEVSSLQWASKSVFHAIPSTGYYFPIIYTPQALGLSLGELFGLTIQQSYYFARLCAFMVSMLLIGIAFHLFPPNPLVVALLLLPMSVFQFVSAGMDGVALSLTILCIALFMRGCIVKYYFSKRMAFALSVALFILTSSRFQVLVFIFMPFIVAFQRREITYLWHGIGLVLMTLGWLYLGIMLTSDGGMNHPGISHFDMIKYYLTNPQVLAQVMLDTIRNPSKQLTYLQELIGKLGWLDTSFSPQLYSLMAWLLAAVTILSVSLKKLRENWLPRITLVLMFLGSVFTIFFALLIQWNPFPTVTIEGVQGRYFIIPLCAFGYALHGEMGFKNIPSKAAMVFLGVMVVVVALKMPQLLLARYFISSAPVA